MSSCMLCAEEEVLKVLANQKRLEIILLLEDRELNVTQMTQMLGLRQANLSQHLTLLREQRLVTMHKKGREVYYTLADQAVAQSIRLLHDFLRAQHRVEVPLPHDDLFPIVADPVCGMRFSASQAVDHTTQDGITYYFCASGCKKAFLASQVQQTVEKLDRVYGAKTPRQSQYGAGKRRQRHCNGLSIRSILSRRSVSIASVMPTNDVGPSSL